MPDRYFGAGLGGVAESIRGVRGRTFGDAHTRPPPNAAGRALADLGSKIGVWTQCTTGGRARRALAGTIARHMRTCVYGPPPQRKERRPTRESQTGNSPALAAPRRGGNHDRKEAMCVHMESWRRTHDRGAREGGPHARKLVHAEEKNADRGPTGCAAAEKDGNASGTRARGAVGVGTRAGTASACGRTSQNLAPIWLPHWPPWI